MDAVSGNDSLARRGCLTVPLKTLGAAKLAAQSGDTIMVLPGTYHEDDLLKNGVNWFFMPGAIVDSTSGDTVFDTGASAITSVIAGHGEFYADGTVLDCSGGGSNILLEALRMESRNSSCIVSGAASGRLHVKVLDSIKAPSGSAIELGGAAEDNIFEAHTIDSSSYSVHCQAGGAYVKAHTISSGSSPINIVGGVAFVVDAFQILASGANAVQYSYAGPLLTIRGARIETTDVVAVSIAGAASDKVRLSGCLLLTSVGSYAIDASTASTRVHILGGTTGNRDKGSNVSVVPGTWQFNTNIT